MLTITHGVSIQNNESEFTVHEFPPEQSILPEADGSYDYPLYVRVHPWARKNRFTQNTDREVFVEVGYKPWPHDEKADPQPSWCIIVDRDEFVQGLLETFPELKRAE